MQNIDTKVRSLWDELSLDIASETRRIDQILTTVQSMQTRMDGLEQSNINTPTMNDNGSDDHPRTRRRPHSNWGNPLDDPELTITASGIPDMDAEDAESLIRKAKDIIRCMGDDVSANVRVTAATRLPRRFDNKPGIVKFSLNSVDEKVLILRNKMLLKDSENYKTVYIRSSKSHVERLIEMNGRAILRNLPGASHYA